MSAQAAVRPAAPHRPSPAVAVACVLVALTLGVGGGALLGRLRAPSAPQTRVPALRGQAVWGPGARPAPAITHLVDQSGHPFTLGALHGHTLALAFLDSHCSAACPLEGRALSAALRAVPAARRPVLVVVSVNPLDSPASTRAALHRWGLGRLGTWHWLRGTRGALARVWSAYHIFVAPARGDIVHTEALYLIDRRGGERSAYLYPFLPRFVAADLTRLAAQPAGTRIS